MPASKVFVGHRKAEEVLEELHRIAPHRYGTPFNGYVTAYFPTFDEGGFQHDVPVTLHATRDKNFIIISYNKKDLLPIHRSDPYIEDVIFPEFESDITSAFNNLVRKMKLKKSKPSLKR